MIPRASYLGVFATFARNSLVRNMMFRANFLIECVSSVTWTMMNLGFYLLIFRYTSSIGQNTGWGEWEFFAFLATTMLVNSLVQAFFMPNCEDISELIRTEGPLVPRRAVRIINQVAGALEATHALGIMHRNVKPSSVLVQGMRAALRRRAMALCSRPSSSAARARCKNVS